MQEGLGRSGLCLLRQVHSNQMRDHRRIKQRVYAVASVACTVHRGGVFCLVQNQMRTARVPVFMYRLDTLQPFVCGNQTRSSSGRIGRGSLVLNGVHCPQVSHTVTKVRMCCQTRTNLRSSLVRVGCFDYPNHGQQCRRIFTNE